MLQGSASCGWYPPPGLEIDKWLDFRSAALSSSLPSSSHLPHFGCWWAKLTEFYLVFSQLFQISFFLGLQTSKSWEGGGATILGEGRLERCPGSCNTRCLGIITIMPIMTIMTIMLILMRNYSPMNWDRSGKLYLTVDSEYLWRFFLHMTQNYHYCYFWAFLQN